MPLLARLFRLIVPAPTRRVRRDHAVSNEALECRNLLAAAFTPTVSVTASDASAAETAAGKPVNGGTFVLTRSGLTTTTLTVAVNVSGTAVKGTDYTAIPATVTFPIGAASVSINVAVLDDFQQESAETVIVTLTATNSYKVGTASATVTIADDESTAFNDLFSKRTTLFGTSASSQRVNHLATKEKGEPTVAGVGGGKTLWWTWKAPSNGTVTLTTAGSSFDTVMGVYTGTSISSLRLVAANDDENEPLGVYTSQVTFTAVAGKSYQIVVDGYKGRTGSVSLALTLTVPTTTTTATAARQTSGLFF